MQNNLADLQNHLFQQLEALNDNEVLNDDAKLEKALARTNAMCKISKEILHVADIQIKAIKTAESCNLLNKDMPSLIATKDSQTAIEESTKIKQRLIGGLV